MAGEPGVKHYEYPGLEAGKFVEAYGPRGRINRLDLIANHIPEHASTAMLESITNVTNCIMDDDLYTRTYNKAIQILGEGTVVLDEFLLQEVAFFSSTEISSVFSQSKFVFVTTFELCFCLFGGSLSFFLSFIQRKQLTLRNNKMKNLCVVFQKEKLFSSKTFLEECWRLLL